MRKTVSTYQGDDVPTGVVQYRPTVREIASGDVLFREGESASEVWFVVAGVVKLVCGATGRHVTVGLRHAGSLLGGGAAMLGGAHRLSTLAVGPTRAHCLSAEAFKTLVETNAAFNSFAMRAICRESHTSTNDCVRLSLLQLEQRFISLESNSLDDRNSDGDLGGVRIRPDLRGPELVDPSRLLPDELDALVAMWQHIGSVSVPRDTIEYRSIADFAVSPRVRLVDAKTRPRTMGTAVIVPRHLEPVVGRDERVRKALAFIRHNYMDATLDLERVSREVSLSMWHFSRLFKRTIGHGFRQHLNAVRIERARATLLLTDLSIKEVSAAVGYNYMSELTRRFKAVHAIGPSVYRRRFRAA